MSEYFPKPKSIGAIVKFELDLCNYPTKADSKIATGVYISEFAKKADLVNSKPNVEKLDIDKLKIVLGGLNSLNSKVDKLNIENQKLLQFILVK